MDTQNSNQQLETRGVPRKVEGNVLVLDLDQDSPLEKVLYYFVDFLVLLLQLGLILLAVPAFFQVGDLAYNQFISMDLLPPGIMQLQLWAGVAPALFCFYLAACLHNIELIESIPISLFMLLFASSSTASLTIGFSWPNTLLFCWFFFLPVLLVVCIVGTILGE